jgi:cytochrome c-type biogenesis protein CcmH/NrfF
MRRLPPALLAALILALAVAPSAFAAAPKTSLPDIEDEVMCPICGTLLELSDSPQANRERAYIRQRIARGETKGQIKDALVTEYGDQVLALPKGSGFDLTAYLVPIAGFLIAAVALAFAVLRWRRRGGAAPAPAGAPPEGPDAERLDADIARYDL